MVNSLLKYNSMVYIVDFGKPHIDFKCGLAKNLLSTQKSPKVVAEHINISEPQKEQIGNRGTKDEPRKKKRGCVEMEKRK